jgi:ElaB/YqjD/DUF883 family membrane-anchored ribosome-binding protein
MDKTTTASASHKQVDRLSKTAHDTVERAADYAASAADRVSEKYDELYRMQEDWVEAGREYVREHPAAALGIALAAGYILSMLMRRR